MVVVLLGVFPIALHSLVLFGSSEKQILKSVVPIGPGGLEALPIRVLAAHEETPGDLHHHHHLPITTQPQATTTTATTTIQVPSAHLLHSLASPANPTAKVLGEENSQDKKISAFTSKVDRWAEKLASSCDLIEVLIFDEVYFDIRLHQDKNSLLYWVLLLFCTGLDCCL